MYCAGEVSCAGIFHRTTTQKIGKENVFYDIIDRKNALLGYKNNKFKKSKTWDFSKLVQGFSPKFALFQSFFYYLI